MAGRLIGEAYIALLADADMFKPDADAKVKAAVRGMKATIPVEGDTAPLDRKVAAAAARMKAMKAVVPIDGDTKGIIRDISGLYVALDGLRNKAQDIPLDLSNNGAMKSIFAVLGGIDAMEAKLEKVEEKGLEFNLNKAISQFYGMQGIIEDTALKAENMKADFEDVNALAKLSALGKFIDKLSTDLKDMRANVDTLAEHAQVAGMQAQAYKLAKTLAGMTASVDTLPFERDMLRLAAQAEAFSKRHIVEAVSTEMGLPITSAGAAASLGRAPGWMNSAASLGSIAGMGAAQTAALWERLNNDFRTTGTVTRIAAAGLERIAAGQSMIMGAGTGWNAWTNKIRLFGGALDKMLPSWARAISLWHLGLDVLFEFAAAWTPAIIAVGTFAAYAAPVAEKIYSQWKNINTVIDGTGGHLKDLGGSFDTVERAIEPGILAAFGEYMLMIGRNAGPMAEALKGVGNVVDVWGAALVNWSAKATASFDRTLHSGTSDFALIGAGFKSLFQIIGELIHDMPGIVHVLLPVGDAFLQLTANVLKTLGPIVSFGLLIHGVMVYAGLAVTAVVALGRAMATAFAINFTKKTGIALMGEEATVASGKFSKFGAAIGGFFGTVSGGAVALGRWAKETGQLVGEFGLAETATSKLSTGVGKLPGISNLAGGGFRVFGAEMSGGALAAGSLAAAIGVGVVGALVYFAVKTYNAKSAAQQLNAELNKLIANSTSANFSQNLTLAFNKVDTAIQKNNSDLLKLTGTTNVTSKTLTQMGPALANPVFGFSALGQKVNDANANLNENKSTVLQLTGYAENYGSRMNALAGIFGSTGAAQAALNLKGISAGQIAKETNAQFAEQQTELAGLAQGYGYMGQNVGAAAAQLNTLNISTGKTFKNVQALQQAESQWVSTITGGETAFTTFEQGQNTLNSTLKGTAGSAVTLRVRVGNLSQTYSAVGAKMTGTSAAALAARQAFDQQLTAATTLWGNLQMLSAASGNTAKSQASLGKAGKDIIAQLLPFAAGSKQATAEVSALAQVMGGPATDNFQVLAKWVGRTKGAESDLNTQQANLTISASNLSVAAKNLGNALMTGLTAAEAAAIAKTFGLNNAVLGLASNVQKSGHQVNGTAVSLAGEYVSALTKAGVSTKDATSNLNAYLARLGYTPSQIKAIDSQLGDSKGAWDKYEAAVNHNISAQKNFGKATAANASAFKNMQINIDLGSAANNALWHAITKQDAAMVANNGHAVNARKVFADMAVNGLGLTVGQANALWAKFGHQNLDWLATHAGNAKKSFVDFAQNGLHLSTAQAQALWKMFAEQQLDMLIAKGDKAKGHFVDFAMNGLGLTRQKANDLWNTLEHQYLDTVANKAGETKQAFEKTAAQFGLTKAQADNLWSSLHKLSAGSPYGVNVNETLTGSGKLMAKVSGNSVVIAASGANVTNGTLIDASRTVGHAAASLGHHAAGYMVPAGGSPAGQDGHLAMLAPGELVIPTSHVAPHLAMAKAQGIPGMAAGGLTPGNVSAVVSAAQNGVPTMKQGALDATANGMNQFAQNVNNTFQMLQAQVNGIGGRYGGPASFGGGFESLAALVAFARYFMQNGLNAAAAAGMAATISGEENSLGPESRGTGGFGLIGWTGNTVGLPAGYTGPTGNVAYDLQQQLRGVIGYMNSRGGAGPLNAAGNPVAAGDVWSRYEAPKIMFSDTRPATAVAIYAALMGANSTTAAQAGNLQGRLGMAHHFTGGMVNEPVAGVGLKSGLRYSFAERSPEYVGPLSGGTPTSGGQQQPMTNIQGQQTNNQLAMIVKLLSQLPVTIAKAQAQGNGNGVRHGYYGAQA